MDISFINEIKEIGLKIKATVKKCRADNGPLRYPRNNILETAGSVHYLCERNALCLKDKKIYTQADSHQQSTLPVFLLTDRVVRNHRRLLVSPQKHSRLLYYYANVVSITPKSD